MAPRIRTASAAARNPLDFGLDDALHQPRQIVVEPGFQHRPQHFLDQIFQRPRVVAQHGIGQRIEGGFHRRHGRARQDRLVPARRLERRLRGRLAAWRGSASVNSISSCGSTLWNAGRGGGWRRLRQRHLVGEFEHVAVGLRRAGCRPRASPRRGSPAWRRCRPGCCWRRPVRGGGGGGGAGFGARSRLAAPAQSPTAECPSSRPASAAGAAGLAGLFGSGRLGLVVGDDATDRRQNLLHRGLLDLCRLRHLRLHIINTDFTPSHEGFAGSGYAGRDFHRTSLTCPQIKRRPPHRARVLLPSRQPQAASVTMQRRGTNCSARPRNGMSWQQLIASKAPGASGAGR